MLALVVFLIGLLAAFVPLALLQLPVAGRERAALTWTASVSSVVIAMLSVIGAGHLMFDAPRSVVVPTLAGVAAIAVAYLVARSTGARRPPDTVLSVTVQFAGIVVLAAVVLLVVLGGWESPLHHRDRTIALATISAAIIAAVLAAPLRVRLRAFGRSLRSQHTVSLDEAVATVGARMSRAVPMEELLRQLAESLRMSAPGMRVEIWTGADGELSRNVSVPAAEPTVLHLRADEQVVIARARIGGPAWTSVWLPPINAASREHRVVPIAHLGELLGLLVLHRAAGGDSFTEAEEETLVDIARRLGLALHNVRLDSALQASLAELAARNVELESSRRRIVTAADASRREIERDLHDGAQQRLVALAVQLGLAIEQARDDPQSIPPVLEALRDEVRGTLAELRELAHGIYPPLLRDRGLNEALRAAAGRSGVRCEVDSALPARYAEAVEAAFYFCCLEALQNAAKYGGSDVAVRVVATELDGELRVDVIDDGPGFDVAQTPAGHGITNMTDRLGALGGTLDIESAPEDGARITFRLRADHR